mmetsp:Transcript_43736/g.103304  ORF Transcript_43736/g.103304 Transcript_43736/m.103304 type:complete len:377 (+) Transcript_43736:49-1179(+)
MTFPNGAALEPTFMGSGLVAAAGVTFIVAVGLAFVDASRGQKNLNGHARGGVNPAGLDLVALLRQAEGNFHFSALLKCTGSACLIVGLTWAAWTMVVSHPYVVLVSIGFLFLAVAAVSSEAGLLAFAPADIQELLLQKSPFDILVHDDAPFVNFMRRWGRMMLLSSQRSTAEVEHVVQGLQPQFVAWVFKRNVELMPQFVQRLLLSEEQAQAEAETPAVGDAIASSQLTELLDQKHEERETRYTEPPLAPVIFRLVMNGLPREVKYLLAGIALPGYVLSMWEYIAALAIGGWATRLSLRTSSFVYMPLARTLFPMLGATADVTLDSSSTRTARTLSAMGFVGAGMLALHALYVNGRLRFGASASRQADEHPLIIAE